MLPESDLGCTVWSCEGGTFPPRLFTRNPAQATIKEKADVAQLVEQLIRNQQVSGSIPLVGSRFSITYE